MKKKSKTDINIKLKDNGAQWISFSDRSATVNTKVHIHTRYFLYIFIYLYN